MPRKTVTPGPTKPGHRPMTPAERSERKDRVLKAKTPSVVRSIADALVIKAENLYFLAEPDGGVPLGDGHGFGLYYHDCRFLNGYEIRLGGVKPDVLASVATEGYRGIFQLTNPDLKPEGEPLIPKDHLGLQWERIIDPGDRALHDRLEVHNYGFQAHKVTLSLCFQANFEDVYEVRGLVPERFGTVLYPEWCHGGSLCLAYQGADEFYRSTVVHFDRPPDRHEATTAHFDVELAPGESWEVLVSIIVSEARKLAEVKVHPHRPPDFQAIATEVRERNQRWLGRHAAVRSESILLDRILDRSFKDLHMLRSHLDRAEYFAAGVPWFATLFGRDSLITSYQMLAYDPSIAAQTLRLLASKQGTKVDDWRDEQPGKILHELRVGEMARLDEIPDTPYYGTVDATILFLILIAEHSSWSGSLDLFEELRDNVERALGWIAHYGHHKGNPYVVYDSTSRKGLINQGWKDSGDAIVNADGTLACPPIAMAEVQGYTYLAKRRIADLYQRSGNPKRAERLLQEAAELKERFNRDFWCEDIGTYAMALQVGGKPVAVSASNAGQVLWTGIADDAKAARVAQRLMAEDMFNGWGVRTLSSREMRYNPIGYHLGTVWPHDNSLIAAGLRRYGHDHAAYRIFNGLFEAASDFTEYRMPELFSGFAQAPFLEPVHYPVACHPQAWAAGSMPLLIATLLGLQPEAFEQRLRIVRPILPHFAEFLELERVSVGNALVNLRFERHGKDIDVKIDRMQGSLDVIVEGQGSPKKA
ncbi:MAG TPA: glycogen debranching N-terminal domain-containing protein [Stenomitos sp.]